MIDNNQPISSVTVQSVLPGARLKSGGRLHSKSIDVRGRILHVRNGRHRPRRYSPIPFGGTNRRQQRRQRRATGVTDNSGDRVVTLLISAGSMFDTLIGKDVYLKIPS
ncbi:MAG: hypothetical protein J7M09_07700 [Deltaproteobacteria bacterium]|nr:hypothetical protein [Candidatus Tharpella sp.]